MLQVFRSLDSQVLPLQVFRVPKNHFKRSSRRAQCMKRIRKYVSQESQVPMLLGILVCRSPQVSTTLGFPPEMSSPT